MAGRFAPSPTGPLHLGSLATALASYLDAKAHGLAWWLRMEDLDPPREPPQAAAHILAQLIDHGLIWDRWPMAKGGRADGVLYQSDRAAGLVGRQQAGEIAATAYTGRPADPTQPAYAQALDRLIDKGMAFRCRCSRSQISQQAALLGLAANADGEFLYPGTCRPPAPPVSAHERHAWRFYAPSLQNQSADNFVLRRADRLWAYHLAVVVDDAFQGITRIVRGSDLATALPRHRELQEALGLDRPEVLHVPVMLNPLGQKLSKQSLAPALEGSLQAVRRQKRAAWQHLESHMPAIWLEQVRPHAQKFLG
nr:Glutamyl-Q tRNA(Asp) synthetase [Cupriavidus sp.]